MENGLNKRSRLSDLFFMLPAFVFALSILLVRLHQFSMPMTDVYWSEATDTTTLSDLFNYWKAMAIIIAACLSVIIIFVGFFKDLIQFKKSFLYIPALVYVAFVLISLAFSKYKYFALRGMSEHFEGTIVLLAYIMMMLFLANAVDSERRLKFVVYCALGAAFLLGILGVTQATGHDFFTTATGQKLMTPNTILSNGIKSWDMIDMMNASGQKVYDFAFTEGEVYQTVYNINYVPFYLSLLIPVSAIIFVALGMSENKTKKGLSIFFLVLYGLYLYNFFAARSASGYFGLVAIFVSALIVFHKYMKKWYKPIICLIVMLGLVMGLTANWWLSEIGEMVSGILYNMTGYIYAEDMPVVQQGFDNAPASQWIDIDYIHTDQGYFEFGINHSVLRFVRDDENSSFVISDGEGNPLYITTIPDRDGEFQILDDRFHDYAKLSLESDGEHYIVIVTTNKHNWKFVYHNGTFYYINRIGKYCSLDIVPHSNLFSDHSFASGRGRIWATTIPMLKNYIFKGQGADTYPFVYPQNDYVALYNLSGVDNLNLITDKAHNLYMQYWVNTGFISLLAWLTLIGYYLVGAVKAFRKSGFVDFSDYVNGGIFCGIIGFLCIAFLNDGSTNTMPMFYTMLGTGLAINMKDRWISENKSNGKQQAIMPEL